MFMVQVTLYHWDLPQALQDQGGWLNDSSVSWLLNYADTCFQNFGPKASDSAYFPFTCLSAHIIITTPWLCLRLSVTFKVKYWFTFNEPYIFVSNGYGNGKLAPGIASCPGTCTYQAAHNVIKAHAKAWRLYDNNYRSSQNGLSCLTAGGGH